MPINGSQVGAFSLAEKLVRVDGRTRLGKLMTGIRLALVEHVGGAPNVAQQLLIHSATIKQARLILLEARMLDTDALAEGDRHQYLAWSNSLRRDLEALGLRQQPRPSVSLEHFLEGEAQGATA